MEAKNESSQQWKNIQQLYEGEREFTKRLLVYGPRSLAKVSQLARDDFATSFDLAVKCAKAVSSDLDLISRELPVVMKHWKKERQLLIMKTLKEWMQRLTETRHGVKVLAQRNSESTVYFDMRAHVPLSVWTTAFVGFCGIFVFWITFQATLLTRLIAATGAALALILIDPEVLHYIVFEVILGVTPDILLSSDLNFVTLRGILSSQRLNQDRLGIQAEKLAEMSSIIDKMISMEESIPAIEDLTNKAVSLYQDTHNNFETQRRAVTALSSSIKHFPQRLMEEAHKAIAALYRDNALTSAVVDDLGKTVTQLVVASQMAVDHFKEFLWVGYSYNQGVVASYDVLVTYLNGNKLWHIRKFIGDVIQLVHGQQTGLMSATTYYQELLQLQQAAQAKVMTAKETVNAGAVTNLALAIALLSTTIMLPAGPLVWLPAFYGMKKASDFLNGASGEVTALFDCIVAIEKTLTSHKDFLMSFESSLQQVDRSAQHAANTVDEALLSWDEAILDMLKVGLIHLKGQHEELAAIFKHKLQEMGWPVPLAVRVTDPSLNIKDPNSRIYKTSN